MPDPRDVSRDDEVRAAIRVLLREYGEPRADEVGPDDWFDLTISEADFAGGCVWALPRYWPWLILRARRLARDGPAIDRRRATLGRYLSIAGDDISDLLTDLERRFDVKLRGQPPDPYTLTVGDLVEWVRHSTALAGHQSPANARW